MFKSMFDGPRIEKYFKILIFIGLLFLLTIIFSQKIEFTAVDLGRHLENGKMIWRDTQVLFKNFYSYTEPGTPFINHHWLGGVIFYGVYLVGSFKLLTVLNILLILAAFFLSFKLAWQKAGFYVAALISLPVIFLLSERVEVRPEIFSYFFIVLTWFILEKTSVRKNRYLLYWLIPVFVFWVNIHIYFFIGLALVGFKAAAEFLLSFIYSVGGFKNRLLAAWEASRSFLFNLIYLFIAALFNPNLIRGLLYPFSILKNYGYEIAENKSVFFLEHLIINPNFFIFKFLLVLLLISFLIRFVYFKKIKLFEFFAAFFFSALACLAVRNLALFSLSALIVISANFEGLEDILKNRFYVFHSEFKSRYKLYFSVALVILIFASIFYLLNDARQANYFIKNSLSWGLSQGSDDSIKFFRENKLSGPIFNNYDLGSALIFWLYPQEKVFVDNRPEAYGRSFFDGIYRPMQEDHSQWLKFSDEYKFKAVYFSHTDSTPWAQIFLSQIIDDNWKLVYFDRYAVIYLNKSNNDQEAINRLALGSQAIRARLRSLSAESNLKSKFQLASLARFLHQPDIAEEIYQEIIFLSPGNGQALIALGAVYADGQNRAALLKARHYFQQGISSGYRLPGTYSQLALINWRLGDYALAEKNWLAALKLEANNKNALYYLEQVKQFRKEGKIK